MALKRKMILGFAVEDTEGTFKAVQADTDFILVSELAVSPEGEFIERNLLDGSIGAQASLIGVKSGTVSFTAELKPSGTVETKPELHELLEAAFGSEVATTSGTTIGGSTTTVIELGVGEGALFAVDTPVLIGSEIGWIKSIAVDTLTLHANSAVSAPASGVTVQGGFTYKLLSDGHQSISLSVDMDGTLFKLAGCKLESLEMLLNANQIPVANMSWSYANRSMDVGAVPFTPVYSTVAPAIVQSVSLTKDGVDLDVGAYSTTLAHTIVRQEDITEDSGVKLYHIAERRVSGNINPFLEASDANFDLWDAAGEAELLINHGSTGGAVIAMRLPKVQYESYAPGDEGGVLLEDIGYRAAESSTQNDELFLGFI